MQSCNYCHPNHVLRDNWDKDGTVLFSSRQNWSQMSDKRGCCISSQGNIWNSFNSITLPNRHVACFYNALIVKRKNKTERIILLKLEQRYMQKPHVNTTLIILNDLIHEVMFIHLTWNMWSNASIQNFLYAQNYPIMPSVLASQPQAHFARVQKAHSCPSPTLCSGSRPPPQLLRPGG